VATDDAILVVGADGMIGRALWRRFTDAGRRVVRTTLRGEPGATALDLSCDAGTWRPPCAIDVAYLCAAETSIDACRRHPAESHAVNVTGALALARALVAAGARVVFLSTNQVFDGSAPWQRPHAPYAPRTEYGRQKAEAEREILGLGGRALVVRFTKVLGPRAPLLWRWAGALRAGEAIRPFSDMVMAPVPLAFAVEALHRVGLAETPGVVQVSGSEDVTYEAAARRVALRVGASHDLLRPVSTVESGVSFEHVPAHTTLDAAQLRDEWGLAPPDVWATIDGAVE
jgi:dTDP-4-dehydrorhamnose reductase